MPLKINVKSVMMYVIYALCLVFANCALKGVPLSLGIMVSMLLCGTNIIVTPLAFAIASVVDLNYILSILSIVQAAFFALIVFLYRRFKRKIKF